MSSPTQLGNEDNPLLSKSDAPPTPDKRSRKIAFLIGDDKKSQVDLASLLEQNYEAMDTSEYTEETSLESTADPKEGNILIELFDLNHHKDDEWVESARWVKYEEDVEGVSKHWGRPHVSCLFYENIKELGGIMQNAFVMNNVVASNYAELVTQVEVSVAKRSGSVMADQVGELMRLRQKHVTSNSLRKSVTTLGFHRLMTSTRSAATLHSGNQMHSNPGFNQNRVADLSSETASSGITCLDSKESAQVYAGEYSNFAKPQMLFIRLKHPTCYPEVEDNPLPVRFFVFVMGPKLLKVQYHEIGRSLCTMLSNTDFRNESHTVATGADLVNNLNSFLYSSVLLPPGEIDSKDLIRVDSIRKAINAREKERKMRFETAKVSSVSPPLPEAQMIVHRKEEKGGYFKEFRSDFSGRFPLYWSDFKDAMHSHVPVAILFMFLASVTPAITFGGLMETYTEEAMGVLETLWAMSLAGIVWSLFSAQPLMIVSPTGPVLIFEGCLLMACKMLDLDLHSVRVFVSGFVFLFCILMIAFDGQKLLRLVTAFTEDIFNSLISVIFIFEAIKFLIKTFAASPVQDFEAYQLMYDACLSHASNPSGSSDMPVMCEKVPHPNTALLSTFILITTFVAATVLRLIRESKWFGRTFRRSLGDFSVAIAVTLVSLVQYFFFSNVYVEILAMPSVMEFTNSTARGHGLVIVPHTDKLLIMIVLSFVAAVLLFVIIFVETGLIEVLLTASLRKMRKPGGKAWDLGLVGLLTVVLSVIGLPWMCPACVQSLAHANCLTRTQKKAPGEPLVARDVLEQRVSNLAMSIMIGLFTLLGEYIKIPMACLFGVFLYLGAMNMRDLVLFQRILLIFQPPKYHPKAAYVENVLTRRMHYYTGLQICLVIIVLIVKSIQITAAAFPLVICLFVALRHVILPYFFTAAELEALDGEEESELEDPEEALFMDPRVAFV